MKAVLKLSNGTWKAMARCLEVVGATAFFSLFVSFFALVTYYASTRPLGPQPDHGWTSAMRWGAYGTPDEAAFVDSVLWWAVMSFGVIAIGMGIRIYKLGEDLTPRAR